MSLSWGRRPGPDRAAVVRAQVALASIAVLAAVAASAGPPLLDRVPSIIEADTRQRIQETLDQHVDALARRDLFVYQRTLDRRNAVFDRCMRELFELGDIRAQALRPERVVGLAQAAPSLVRLQVEQRNGIATHYVRRLAVVSFLTRPPFDIRRVFVVWYLSPPGPEEIRARRTRTADDVTLAYWDIDEPLAAPLLREAVLARDLALARAPGPIAPDLALRLAPDRELSAATSSFSCLTAGRYDPSSGDVVLYRYWQDVVGAPSERMREIIRHEVLHWLQRRSVTHLERVDHWLKEGWPQHVVGQTNEEDLLRTELCRLDGTPPTEAELATGTTTSGERSLVLQAAERSLVQHMYRAGADDATYWRLLTLQSDGMGREASYIAVLGMSFERLRADWLAHMRAEC